MVFLSPLLATNRAPVSEDLDSIRTSGGGFVALAERYLMLNHHHDVGKTFLRDVVQFKVRYGVGRTFHIFNEFRPPFARGSSTSQGRDMANVSKSEE
jgi:hypothetical protein